MARTSIARTVIQTICEVKYVDENNEIQKAQIILYGDYDIDHAQNAARKQMHNNRLIVESVSHASFYGKMSLATFAKYCTKSRFKEW